MGCLYCSEVVGEFMRAALGDEAPRIGARDRDGVVDPLDFLQSPDMQVVTFNDAAAERYPRRLTQKNG